MKDDVIYWFNNLPRKQKEPIQRKCSNCGNVWCRSKWKFVCWLNCKDWELFEIDKIKSVDIS